MTTIKAYSSVPEKRHCKGSAVDLFSNVWVGMRVQLNLCKNMGWNCSTAKPSTELVWEGMGLIWLSFYEKFE